VLGYTAPRATEVQIKGALFYIDCVRVYKCMSIIDELKVAQLKNERKVGDV
jgi:hypothetical protein